MMNFAFWKTDNLSLTSRWREKGLLPETVVFRQPKANAAEEDHVIRKMYVWIMALGRITFLRFIAVDLSTSYSDRYLLFLDFTSDQ